MTEPRAKPARRRRRYLRPLDIVRVMRSGTRQQQATGRRIMRERYGFSDQSIDLLMSRAADGRAPIAASHLALALPKRDRLSTKKPEGANEVLDWFFSRGSKIR